MSSISSVTSATVSSVPSRTTSSAPSGTTSSAPPQAASRGAAGAASAAISSATSSVASSTDEQALASLQVDLTLYSQAANGQNIQAKDDYNALQSAITSGNVTEAQADVTKLQEDSNTGKSSTAKSTTHAPVNKNGTTGAVNSSNNSLLDTTA